MKHDFMKPVYWHTFLLDAGSFLTIVLLVLLFSSLLNSQMSVIPQSPQQLQNLMATLAPDQMTALISQLQSLIILTIIGFILLAIFSFLLYSFSQGMIWNMIIGHKLTKKTYWRWNTLNFLLVIILAVLGIAVFIIKLLVNIVVNILLSINTTFYLNHANLMDGIKTSIDNLFLFVAVLFLIIFVFLAYYSFVKSYKVWPSFGEAFNLLYSKRWLKVLGLTVLAAIIITLALLFVKKWLAGQSVILFAVNFVVSFLFLAWFRLYVVKTVEQ